MNILLIYPAFPDTFWSFTHAIKFIRKKAAHPPLGLITVASLLPDYWKKRLVDVNIDNLTDEDLAWADLAFVGGMVVQRSSAHEIISRCKEKGLCVVAGGPLFVAEPECFPEVDHFVLNEAELTLQPFLEDLATGSPRKTYSTTEFADIRKSPVPEWELLRMEKYASMSMQFSRGCPFNCEFCNVTTLFGHRTRMKTPDQVLRELDGLYAAGWRGDVFFVDDNFIGNKRYLKTELLPALLEWRKGKKGCRFYTEASINLADDPKLMHMMVEAGFGSVFIGIESPDEESLSECRKSQNTNRNLLEDVRRIQRTGLQVMGGFIVGFDADTPSTFQRLVDFIQQSGIVTAMVGMLQAPPGTPLFERLQKEDRLTGILSGDNVDGTTNIIPKMGLDKLQVGYRSIMENLYSPRFFYKRLRTFLREFPMPRNSTPFDINRLLAFWQSCFKLGILGKERFHFWLLISWTLVRRPKQFPLAISMAIYGYHFRRVCEMHILSRS